MNQEEKQIKHKNLQGYNKKFPKPIIYENYPAPLDMMEIKAEKDKGFWRSFVDYWKNLGKQIKKIFKKDKTEIDLFTGTKVEDVFGEPTNVAAEIENIYLTFKNPANPKEKNLVLRGPSLKIYEGKIHALIGESGSGKSVITSLLYGLTGSNAIIEGGKIRLYGLEVQNFTTYNWEKSKLRGRIISAVFQNPMSILDPTMKVGNQIMEGMLVNKLVKSKKEAYQESLKYLKLTKINNPEDIMKKYPHELSGGMIQRVAIASIVSLKPKILVMDEPTTALDPTVQALVLDIIRELQETFNIAIAFITHDLGVVASISDFINIMYAGQIVESGTKEEILYNAQHPYTWGLITSMPDYNKGERLQVIRGAVPSNLNNIEGDAFAVRNDYALNVDFIDEPPMYQISPTHFVKSNLLNEKAPDYEPPRVIKNLWAKYHSTLKSIYGDNYFVDEVIYNHYKNKADEHNKVASELNNERKQILEQRSSSNSANINDSKPKRDDENKINSSESKQTELDQDDYKIAKKSKLSDFFDKCNDNVSGGANE
ncbi:ABC transporter ATP-binding protein [Mycoplasma bovis]|uniref:ABC transporter ATP-binding protein n=1 Tax=Mycoplasmopsis bovis TaxID=28903 RepID=UPI001BDE0AE5|nr:ABC transporter ATP-binding protein [Mycoplasmopsis bovis]MBT1345024.1 ABC transporter ATP-binding protein [Mycoplasmopsis bovis]MBT1371356.1 ABC transporter ATP-binding protein [Mycoplasmopsis bovis]MBT1376139.1 ABC transporter ATP-binding protein [Mycoplasmopsis bovis]MBT1382151.1 ABC transporter ATP-binding protein [Mycoplasmopsis bovis]MBT1383378.1 ABC transporter ATP-binding protein [Mycoplasmopsis bovis]